MSLRCIRPGALDQRIRFEQEARTPDGAGGASRTWVEVATVWASVAPVRARETDIAQKKQGETTYQIVVRRRTDITPAMRAVWVTNGNLAMNIREVQVPSVREAGMTIIADAGAAD